MRNPRKGLDEIPRRLIPLSTMSPSEKKAAAARLQAELQQVRRFRWKSAAAAPAMKLDLEAMLMRKFHKQCDALLRRLMCHKHGWVFNVPVDVVKLNLPDYSTIIKNPMDLGTVKARFDSGGYASPASFAADVRLTFTNAAIYNPPGHGVHVMAVALRKIFETGWKNIEKKFGPYYSIDFEDENEDKDEPTPSEMDSTSSKDRKTPPNAYGGACGGKRIVRFEERQALLRRLETCLTEVPDHILEFLRLQMDGKLEKNSDEIEVDINSFDDAAIIELEKLLNNHFQKKEATKQLKDQSCNMELMNESGLSNSSRPPCSSSSDSSSDSDSDSDSSDSDSDDEEEPNSGTTANI